MAESLYFSRRVFRRAVGKVPAARLTKLYRAYRRCIAVRQLARQDGPGEALLHWISRRLPADLA